MKKQFLKIKVSILWIPYLIFLYYFKVTTIVWIVFMMLIVHELGHVWLGYSLHISLESITIYPFGIFAQYSNIEDYPSHYELLMAIAGIGFQVFNFIILNILYQYQFISLNQLDYYQMLNVQMALFNLLPIYPLDGGRVLRSLCLHVFTYGMALKITYCISILVFIVSIFHLSSFWLIGFVVLYSVYIYREMQNIVEKQLLFYYRRFRQNIDLKNKIHGYRDLYKDYHNIVIKDKCRLTEKDWIARYFVNK